MEEILLNPNVVYLASVTGVLFAFMAISSYPVFFRIPARTLNH